MSEMVSIEHHSHSMLEDQKAILQRSAQSIGRCELETLPGSGVAAEAESSVLDMLPHQRCGRKIAQYLSTISFVVLLKAPIVWNMTAGHT
jgi:hypothetical protein